MLSAPFFLKCPPAAAYSIINYGDLIPAQVLYKTIFVLIVFIFY
jgi:hypothetical protein